MQEINIRIQQFNPIVGDIDGNRQQILAALELAENSAIDLLVLPEMCTCGYSPGDLMEYPAFLKSVYTANRSIIEATRTTALVFGSLTQNNKMQGQPYFNAAVVAQEGRKIAEIHKTLLPNYDVYDEARYFEQNNTIRCIEWQGRTLGITICEDIWENFDQENKIYAVNPVHELVKLGAEAIINISASPFTVTKSENRLKILQAHTQAVHRPVFYTNQVGGNDSLISDGDAMVLNANGQLVARAPLFEDAFIDVRWHEHNTVEAINHTYPLEIPSRTERIFLALKQGVADYFRKTGVTSDAVVGLSGGIDSSLVACIAVEALGAAHVSGVAMPSEFSSQGSVDDAKELARNLGISFQKIPIKSVYQSCLSALEPAFEGTSFGTAEENLQARIRGIVLMAIANKFNTFVLSTGNKSEAAVGYCTLYGDTNGALAVISDLYKTEVYKLSRWLNETYYKKETIPQNILDKPPSAELRPGQKDNDSLPEYAVLDLILKLYIEKKQSAKDIIDQGFDTSLVKRIVRLVNQNEFKRRQAPPGIKIHEKAFGTGRRLPVVQKWEACLDKI